MCSIERALIGIPEFWNRGVRFLGFFLFFAPSSIFLEEKEKKKVFLYHEINQRADLMKE